MFPISQRTLTFWKIADYWSREIKPPAPHSELFDLLIQAWWSGEFREASYTPRLEFLKNMLAKSRTNEPDDIVFTFEDEDEPPSVEYLQDGSALVDTRPRIPLPSRNVDSWTEATCKPAFLLLASDEVKCSEHYRYWIIAFGWFVVTHDEFMVWLHRHHFSIPTFWEANVSNQHPLPVTAATTEPVSQVQKLQHASEARITQTITEVYESAKLNGVKPPNLVQIVKPVQERLRAIGYEASGKHIQELASTEQFEGRRRKPGKTVASETRSRRK